MEKQATGGRTDALRVEALRAANERLQRRNHEIEIQNERLELLERILGQRRAGGDLDDLLAVFLEHVGRQLPVCGGSIWIPVDEGMGELVCRSLVTQTRVGEGGRIGADEGAVGWAFVHGQSLLVSEPTVSEVALCGQRGAADGARCPVFVIPLQAAGGVVGVLQLLLQSVTLVPDTVWEMLEDGAGVLGTIVANLALCKRFGERRVEPLATVDRSRERLLALLRSVQDVVAVHDPVDGRFLFCHVPER